MNAPNDGILVFGGSFDPPHLAHARLPPFVAEVVGMARVLYVPAALNPLKRESPPTDAPHRLAMLRLALRSVPNSVISTIELERGGPSYTVDTLRQLREQLGEQMPVRLLIGADQAIEFHKWKDWRRIIDMAEPVVMFRPPWNRDELRAGMQAIYSPEDVDQWVRLAVDVPAMSISSSEIRHRLRSGGDLASMLDPAVIEYIRTYNLYHD